MFFAIVMGAVSGGGTTSNLSNPTTALQKEVLGWVNKKGPSASTRK
jgi:hypothetical protein